MNDDRPHSNDASAPITEADLHGFVDRQLTSARHAQVAQYLAGRPDEMARVRDWQRQGELLRDLLDPVLDEPLPLRLPLQPAPPAYAWRGLAAGVAIAMLSAGTAWVARGSIDGDAARLAAADKGLGDFARRAAVAHAVYSPDARRPVEVGAEQEQQLVAWLSKRLGAQVRPPDLKALGHELVGGRLLPGGAGPVAQFMYQDSGGQRLTLYISREHPAGAEGPDAAFRFSQDGPTNVFYWVDREFGYALSGDLDRAALLRVSQAVYRQLGPN